MITTQPEMFNWLNVYVIIAMVLFFSIMLVSEVPMFSLKFKNFKFNENIERFLLLAFTLITIVLLGVGGIAATIIFYILYSTGKWIITPETK
jgi:CDP-diacylglycerol--serine O-phosphatidyltransferase